MPETDEVIFWVFDDNHESWLARPFRGRTIRRGAPKGKGKGKGFKGYRRFKPFGKGKGKGKTGKSGKKVRAMARKAKAKAKENEKGSLESRTTSLVARPGPPR